MIWKLTLSITKRLLELQCAVADKKQNWRTARTHSFDVSISFNFNMLCNGKFIITCLNSFFISGPSTGLSNNCSSSTQFLNLFPFIYNHNYRTIWLFCPTSLNQFKVLILNAERKLCCYCLVMPQCMHEPPNDDFTILNTARHAPRPIQLLTLRAGMVKVELAKYYKDFEMTAFISERSRNSK